MGQFSIENTEQLEIFSKEIGQRFQINIGLPPNYSKENDKYPVVYVTDAGSNFSGLMSSVPLMQLVNDLPHFILVGIDYKSKNSNDSMSLRNRDLTPTNDSVWMSGQKEMYKIFGDLPEAEPGGAKKFLEFIDQKVKPQINNNYHADSSDQTYCGFLWVAYLVFIHYLLLLDLSLDMSLEVHLFGGIISTFLKSKKSIQGIIRSCQQKYSCPQEI